MTDIWEPKETTTHQDHVIAHVIGATFLGYFVFDEVLYILLDIGFIWTIFLDGEMGLLPHPVVVSELEMDGLAKDSLKADIDLLLGNDADVGKLLRLKPPPVQCLINDVGLFAVGEQKRWLITGEEDHLAIETSIATREVFVMTFDDAQKNNGERIELNEVAQGEQEYLHERLREDLGREPTEEELAEWLRQHTEGY